MEKAETFDELLARAPDAAMASLNCANNSIMAGKKLLKQPWQSATGKPRNAGRAVFEEAYVSLMWGFADLFPYESTFEAEAKAFKFLSLIRNYLVTDYRNS